MLPFRIMAREFSLPDFLRRASIDRLERELPAFVGGDLLSYMTLEDCEWLSACDSNSAHGWNGWRRGHTEQMDRQALAKAYLTETMPEGMDGVGDDGPAAAAAAMSRIKSRSAPEAAAAPAP
jgi:hypothetical protein